MDGLHLFNVFILTIILQGGTNAQNCDELGVLLYEDLGCSPVYCDGYNCPIKYECNLEPTIGKCLFRNHYYEFREDVPYSLLQGTCIGLASCEEEGWFIYAIADCIEYFVPPDDGCYYAYDHPYLCCSSGQKCTLNNDTNIKCYSSGQEYIDGLKINLENTCETCICNENFNNGNPDCQRMQIGAQIYNQYEILNKCAPVYYGMVKCAPGDWICPSGQEIVPLTNQCGKEGNNKIIINLLVAYLHPFAFAIMSNGLNVNYLKCQFGNTTVDYGHGFKTIRYSVEITCECKLPPLLTCLP